MEISGWFASITSYKAATAKLTDLLLGHSTAFLKRLLHMNSG